MDYSQERITTLHDFGDANPPAPLSRATVIVPVTYRDFAGLAPERVFSSLASLEPAEVVVPVRAPAEWVGEIGRWLEGFDLPLRMLWCNAPEVTELLDGVNLDGSDGKGRDVWLAVGLATDAEFIALHDADVRSHESRDVRKLLFPLERGFSFVKGYYARVENGQLYGRLLRLLFEPLVRTIAGETTAPLVQYLDSFRYALAGEMAMTASLARELRFQRQWGLEVGLLGEAFREAGFDGTAQVDLGRHEHEHRAISGPSGLSDMSEGVVLALLRILDEQGVDVDTQSIKQTYRSTATGIIQQYRADATFNDLSYDLEHEREQISAYAEAITEPGPDDRLPAWSSEPLQLDDLERARRESLERVT
ncbi:MAG: glycosyl transferase family 2 [Halodesulfurarchaeum sp.]